MTPIPGACAAPRRWPAGVRNSTGIHRNLARWPNIALTFFAVACTIGVTGIVAMVLLGFVMSVMDAFVQVIPIAGAKALYYAGGLLLLVGFIPFAARQWKVLRERLKYRYDMFDWVSIPVMVITYVAVIVIVTPAAIHYFVG